MAIESTSTLRKQVDTLFRLGTLTGLADGVLLERFRLGPGDESEAAFAALVDRHGAMVLEVCRRILGDRHDAEDSAQATFLVLARRARSIRRGESVSSWLYGTARGSPAGLAAAPRDAAPASDAPRRRRWPCPAGDSRPMDRASRGMTPGPSCTRSSAVCPTVSGCRCCSAIWKGSATSRRPGRSAARCGPSSRGCRGPACGSAPGWPGAGLDRVRPRPALGGPLRLGGLAAGMPSEAWKHATVTAAVRYAAGGTAALVVSEPVAALVQGVLKAMFIQRAPRVLAATLLIAALACGAGVGMGSRASSDPPGPRPAASAAPADESRYRATYNGGAAVEIVAVSSVPTGPNTWWKPDGTPLAEAPVDAIESRFDVKDRPTARVILVRVTGVGHGDGFRWHPSPFVSSWGSRPKRGGQPAPGLEYYEATFVPDQSECRVWAKVAAGPWKTEASNEGRGGVGFFANGHKYDFGKARAYQAHGRSLTAISVAHNAMGQDRRLIALDGDGHVHTAVWSSGSDGDPSRVLDQIDAEFDVTPDRVKVYQVQFRPYERKEIAGITLKPRS